MYDIKMGSGLNAPCWVSETQKGGHKALPYIIYIKEKEPDFRLTLYVGVTYLPG